MWVPTIKIFYPHSKLEFEGFEVPYEADEEYFVDLLLYSLTYLEEKTGDTAVSLKALRSDHSVADLKLFYFQEFT